MYCSMVPIRRGMLSGGVRVRMGKNRAQRHFYIPSTATSFVACYYVYGLPTGGRMPFKENVFPRRAMILTFNKRAMILFVVCRAFGYAWNSLAKDKLSCDSTRRRTFWTSALQPPRRLTCPGWKQPKNKNKITVCRVRCDKMLPYQVNGPVVHDTQ